MTDEQNPLYMHLKSGRICKISTSKSYIIVKVTEKAKLRYFMMFSELLYIS